MCLDYIIDINYSCAYNAFQSTRCKFMWLLLTGHRNLNKLKPGRVCLTGFVDIFYSAQSSSAHFHHVREDLSTLTIPLKLNIAGYCPLLYWRADCVYTGHSTDIWQCFPMCLRAEYTYNKPCWVLSWKPQRFCKAKTHNSLRCEILHRYGAWAQM